jgi:hypothetical protein
MSVNVLYLPHPQPIRHGVAQQADSDEGGVRHTLRSEECWSNHEDRRKCPVKAGGSVGGLSIEVDSDNCRWEWSEELWSND